MVGVTRLVVEFMGLVTEVGVAVKVTVVADDCEMEALGVELDPSVMGVRVGKVETLDVKSDPSVLDVAVGDVGPLDVELDPSVLEVGVEELELLVVELDP